MNALFGLTEVSTSIKITRFDDPMHLAKMVQLLSESKSVGVEWNENDEMEGKAIFLDLIFEFDNEYNSI